MPLDYRDYIKGNHPPSCTCVECTNRRLRQLRKEAHPNYISVCPRCGHKSLWHNVKENKYECLNLKCKAVMSRPDEASRIIEHTVRPSNTESDGTIHYSNYVDSGVTGYRPATKQYKGTSKNLPGWMLALLLLFSLSVVGLGLNYAFRSPIPFLILFGAALIYTLRRFVLPTILLGALLLMGTSTVSMVWPQGIVGVTPKPFEVLYILPTSMELRTAETTVFGMVNEKRAEEGLSPLKWDESVASYSRKHSLDMAEKRDLYHNKVELAALRLGENAALNPRLAGGFILLPYPLGLALYKTDKELLSETVEGWMNSTGHRQNILNPNYNFAGVGIAVAEDGVTYYLTQNFK